MVYSLIARIIERIPTIKDLLKRLREDVLFRLDCGFSLAESIPSASTYSRLIQKLSQTEALEEISQNVIKLAFEEDGFAIVRSPGSHSDYPSQSMMKTIAFAMVFLYFGLIRFFFFHLENESLYDRTLCRLRVKEGV